jgi:superkiller protein 3
MAEHEKSLVKSSSALTRFDPKSRKELVVRALNALTEFKDADFYFFKGEEHRMQGELKLAISYYEKALQIDSEHEDSLFWMGWCYLPERKNPTDDDIELDHTVRHEKSASAFQKLVAVLEKKGSIGWGNYAVYHNLGIAQEGIGSYEEAKESFERAIELNPNHAYSYHGTGSVQHRLGLHKEAKESFERAIELNPNDADSYEGLGAAQYSLGLHDEAMKSSEHAIEVDPNNPHPFYNLALSQEALGIYHLALENFDTYLKLENYQIPKTPACIEHAKNRVHELKGLLTNTYYYNMGIDYAEKKQYDKAIECYQRAIDLNPKHVNSYCNLGCINYRLGFYREAIENFKSALKIDSEHAASYYNIGLCQEALGNNRVAIEFYEKSLSFANPESPENQKFIRNAKKSIKELRDTL